MFGCLRLFVVSYADHFSSWSLFLTGIAVINFQPRPVLIQIVVELRNSVAGRLWNLSIELPFIVRFHLRCADECRCRATVSVLIIIIIIIIRAQPFIC
jgi:hypothetical protein